MTAPLTPPPHGSPDHDPWQTSAGYPGASPDSGRSGVGRGALVTVAVALGGVLLGVLWLWLAPRVPLISDGKAVFLQHTEGEEAVGADGTFVLLALAFGAVTALVVFLCLRRGGIPVVIGLAVGGLLGSVIAWRTGVMFGPTTDVAAHAREVGKGVVFDAPLQLRAKGALLAWPVAATAVHLALTGFFGPRDPEPVPPGLWPDKN
ncbi:DUF2567 domain-containing protein [Streptomyces lycii]|uniref:DUF2567 domain-containing protein n=1 Tax=Streptomyces lycii TaxID=2654337 RepID=A0ABQ7FAZ7_9ACTN|nr:DUF2567 domain-containing protein [Streptomyces lycii]KAF4405707.1 DUF2567 domain-containing protein [Streptomyces lycii]